MADLSGGVSLGPELVQHLFPFYIAFDHDLCVTHFGRAVSKVCKNVAPGLPIKEIFSIWRPKGAATFANFRTQSQATFLLDSVTTKIRVRGQMVMEPQLDVLLFVGSPWFTDIEQLQKTDLQLKDFTVHDPIVDFLYMVQAKTLALADAKQFSETVIKQRDELEHTNKELERASAAKSQFLANTSHELRTPLNGIIGMTTLLTRGALSPQQKNCGEKILRSAKALLVVVNDVLDFSKIEAGKMTLETADFNLHELMFDVTEMFAVTAQSKGVDLVCSFAAEVPVYLHGDSGRIRQIVSNLIGNAVKFTDQGDITLRISVDSAQQSGAPSIGSAQQSGAPSIGSAQQSGAPSIGSAQQSGAPSIGETGADDVTLRFQIIDTGIGIDPKHQSALFSAFSQVDGSMTRKHGGTGLGLAISKSLADLMGGATGVHSEPGQGSTFWFTARMKPVGALTEKDTCVVNLSGQRILVIDDSAACRGHLGEILVRSGAQVECAADAIEGLERVRAATLAGKPFDVAIIDAKMPRLTGTDLALVLAGDPAQDALRTVLLASIDQDMQGDDPRSRVRFDATLAKPVQSGHLLRCLAALPGQLRPAQPNPERSLGPAGPTGPVTPVLAPRPVAAAPSAQPIAQAPAQPIAQPPAQPIAQPLAQAPAPPAFQPVAAPPVVARVEAPVAQPPTLRERRVLVVDDHPVNQEVASQMVESMGYRVDIAGNGREAVEAHFRAPYDIILTDLQMPEMDGYEETKEIRVREGTGQHTPIIAMTAHAMAGDRTRALEIGLDDYIAKPIDFDKLASLLQHWAPLTDEEPPLVLQTTYASRPPAADAVVTPKPATVTPQPATIAPPAPPPGPPAIDRSVLDQLRRYQKPGAPDLVADVVRKFLADLPDRIRAVTQASVDGDSVAITKPAHALKSSSAMVGAQRFSQICAELEERCQTEPLEAVADLLTQFRSECVLVQAGLNAVLAPPSQGPAALHAATHQAPNPNSHTP